eukprot:Skav200470  [mRNA]  locus=scaffold5182:63697:69905:+ [translate_table: standard]
MGQFRALHYFLRTNVVVAVQRQVIDMHHAEHRSSSSIGCDGRKGGGTIGRPCNVTYGLGEIKGQNGEAVLVVPQLHRPISGRGDEDLLMERVPTNAVHRHGVTLVGFQVLPAKCLGTLVDSTFLRSHQEEMAMVAMGVEVEAQTTC